MGCMRCPLNGRDEAALHWHIHTVAHRKSARQMLTHSYTCLHTNSQREPVLSCLFRTSALYQDDGQAPEQTFDFSSETHPRNLQPLWMGNRKRTERKTVCESQPFRCLIIKHSLWPTLLQESSLFLSSCPTTHPEKKRIKKLPHCFHH